MRALPIPFDKNYARVYDPSLSIIGGTAGNTTVFQEKLSLSFTPRHSGEYLALLTYWWNHDATGNDFEGRFLQDGVAVGRLHKQEPKDSTGTDATGTTQGHLAHRRFILNLTAGVETVLSYEFRTDAGAAESSTADALLEIFREDLS